VTSKNSVIVVGAGIVGCAIARELAVRGVTCTVFDDRPVAGGATRASAGMLAPYVEAHERGPLLDLAVRSLELYDDWIAAVRRESDTDVEYRRIGTLEVALDPKHAADLRRQASEVTQSEWLEPAAARAAHPELGWIAGALLTRAHGYVAAPQLTASLARAAERQGTTFRRAAVQRITSDGSSVRVTATDGECTADTVVIAAGAWGRAIDGVRMPPLRPVRGQLLHLGWRGHPPSTIIWGPRCYIVPRTDGTLLVGATVEEVGFDERTTAGGVRELLAAACDVLPDAKVATFLEARAGLRPATPDELPVLGSDPDTPNIVHASGHYRNGVLLAPITAKLIGDFVVDGRSDPALNNFRVDRFGETADGSDHEDHKGH
jgi:glycine oxidase ThiO